MIWLRMALAAGLACSVQAQVNFAGRTSMEVGVRVDSEDVRTRVVERTSTAYLTMVALDDGSELVRTIVHEAQLKAPWRLALPPLI